ncbi:ABC transporter substrate-binding protein [Candidatus Marithrix sp. Canyon 246]|uniref:ABC transporter substrate-binding protein n=1 Tax=Candidatus Marithrix sp. Canyon 246 TaxID=1827136 RepID=UPI00084A0F09|nr:ABC transporter substrate-binding protein [Candidatus Marithrix sp. Canyon 246]
MAARELIEDAQTQVIIGAASSSTTIAVAENISIVKKIPLISYLSSSPKITTLAVDEGKDFLFRTVPSDALQGVVLANFAYEKGYRNLSVLYIDNVYGKGLLDVFKDNFNALGGTISAEVSHPETASKDFDTNKDLYLAALQKAKTAGAEGLVVMSISDQSNGYIPLAIENKLFNNFLFVDGSKSEKLIQIVGATALEGMCGTAPGVDKNTTSWKKFEKGYIAEYGGNISQKPFMSNTYDAVISAGLAAYAAQAATGKAPTAITIRDYLRHINDPKGQEVVAGIEGLRQGMKTLNSGLTINYQGASGTVDFDEHGDVIAPIEIWCYEGGEIKSKELR